MGQKDWVGLSWLSLALGIVLASPAVFAFPDDEVQRGVAFVGGVVIAVLSGLALLTHGRWEGWFSFLLISLVVGAIVFIAPITLRYNGDDAATWAPVLVGVAVAVISFAQLWRYTA